MKHDFLGLQKNVSQIVGAPYTFAHKTNSE